MDDPVNEIIAQMATDVNNAILVAIKPYQKRINKLKSEKNALYKALDYAEDFIDSYGKARVKENLGRNGIDAVLNEIDKILHPTNICPICGDEKPIDDLHRNCGK